MRSIYTTTRVLFALGLLFTLGQCDKTPEVTEVIPYDETSLDANGGNWKTYILANGSEIPVAAPEAAGSAAYLTELTDLKAKMAAATSDQKAAAQFWGANGVLRWQEIVRSLCAQYNAAPKVKDDGTYPVPDATKPLDLPRFPFANPPYAARAMALLSVAQYDALVTTWHYKFQYNRLAPYKNDNSIQPLIPTNDLPSYPSEDAVIAAASREVLKFLFPGEKEFLNAKAEEHKNSRLWAGANVQSDLSVGDSLGRIVANRIIAYAKADRMGQANNQAGVAGLRSDATTRGITTQWTSRDLPIRPPMLPFYGNVKTWNFDDATKVSLRPPPPPAVGSAEFETAIKELRDMAKNRTAEQWHIAAYWADGTGTPTPPGHWNKKAADLIYAAEYNELRSARAMALTNTAMQDAGISCWDTKYYYLYPRPCEVDKSVTTSTGVPNFPAYTSGHSTFSGAGAEVLAYLFPASKAEVDAMAKEASESRIYGCIHYRFDCEVGLSVGKAVAGYAVQRGKTDGSE